jgi:hypothetical protein
MFSIPRERERAGERDERGEETWEVLGVAARAWRGRRRAQERERERVCVCVCVNENLMVLVHLRELRPRGERMRRDENARERIKCPVTGSRVTALVARLNVVGGRENTAGPRVVYLSDLRLSRLGLC